MRPITTLTRPAAASDMSDDLTTVRRFFTAWAARDLETLAALIDPDIVIEPIPGLLYALDAYPGRLGAAEALREIAARWHRFEMDVEDARPYQGRVIALVRVTFEKHGMSYEAHIPVVCKLRDGLIVSVADDDAR